MRMEKSRLMGRDMMPRRPRRRAGCTLGGMEDPGAYWSLYDLRIWTERLELRLPTELELFELMEIANSGIHDPASMPFGAAWTDAPSPWFERLFMQFHWGTRATWTPEKWSLDLGVWFEGKLIGTQGMGAENFQSERTVSTGSW